MNGRRKQGVKTDVIVLLRLHDDKEPRRVETKGLGTVVIFNIGIVRSAASEGCGLVPS